MATALKSKLSSKMGSRFRLHLALLLQSWKMGLRSPGTTELVVVTALKSKLSSKISNRLRPLVLLFAAILADGSVVTWGDPGSGGDSSRVQGQIAYLQETVLCPCSESEFGEYNRVGISSDSTMRHQLQLGAILNPLQAGQ